MNVLRRCLQQPRRRLSTVADTPHDRRVRSLVRNLDATQPARVWDSYTDIINASGAAALPVELHQHVLRQCSPPKDVHRQSIRQRIAAGTFSEPFHVHEARFKLVIHNIAAMGEAPQPADYDFIMDHLAAVGYYQGVLALYNHMVATHCTPTARTFNACFRAIAFRFTLPVVPALRADLVAYTTARLHQLMADHARLQLTLSAANMDLILRILKETLDRPSFDLLLRTSYGIDLANPDRLALEYAAPGAPAPLPFTTAALNTTLDLLGRMGDIPRLVVAFEVLTQPLPQADAHFFNSFDEDEDDLGGAPTSAKRALPSAQPNTTTYALLLRHIGRAGLPALARHYALVALRADRAAAWTTRHMVRHRLARRGPGNLSDVPAPRAALARSVLLPVLGCANRAGDTALLAWLAGKLPGALRAQRSDLAFYEDAVARLRAAGRLPPDDSAPLPPSPTQSPTDRPLDPRLHARILTRNIAELTAFSSRVAFVLARAQQRLRERLGRRVWRDQDVYLRSAGARVVLSRDDWRAIVRFRPMDPAHQALRPARSRGPFTPRPPKPTARAMSTAVDGPPKSMRAPSIPALWRRLRGE
ncbi:hypothetical protein HYPSUDRAFT_38756 [Hypholoma sublateritium FD-334 SS-4]|uniref:Pentatricopeptide repeat domain-containing protein n=1 Tax=Hypholoma sublateritium (strain FD-334 SS-4) TaxID=945553 RepID=A0A0D2PZ93_HYPSF|nr:hypothetical protein HYPSUDRAFT_38756 [Hypholoma sublateritium FD-334 SS-4]